jgi:hypothetical protein
VIASDGIQDSEVTQLSYRMGSSSLAAHAFAKDAATRLTVYLTPPNLLLPARWRCFMRILRGTITAL